MKNSGQACLSAVFALRSVPFSGDTPSFPAIGEEKRIFSRFFSFALRPCHRKTDDILSEDRILAYQPYLFYSVLVCCVHVDESGYGHIGTEGYH